MGKRPTYTETVIRLDERMEHFHEVLREVKANVKDLNAHMKAMDVKQAVLETVQNNQRNQLRNNRRPMIVGGTGIFTAVGVALVALGKAQGWW